MSMHRRRYLTLGGATIAAGLAGCQSSDDDTSPSQDPGDSGESTEQDATTESPGSVSVNEILAPGSIQVGEELVAKLALTNSGDQEDTYSGTLEVTGEHISAEEDFEVTLKSGETNEIEAAVLMPECEGELLIKLVNEDLSQRVEVTNYPTPRSKVDDHRYSENNSGVTEYPGPSSQPELVQEYENAVSAMVRINENTMAMVSSTTSSGNGRVRVLEPDGTERWTDTLQYPNTDPALFDGRLYLVDANDLLCYDVETGDVLWKFTEAGPPSDQVVYTEMYGTPLLSDGAVYFNGMHGQVWAINAYSGCKQWNTSLTPDGESNGISGVPAVKDGTLYIVGDDGISTSDNGPLYALNKETGEVQWKTDEENIIGETTPVRDGHVYVRTRERDGFSPTETICAYDIEAGSIGWETELDDLNTAVVVDNEQVYVGRSWPTANSSGELVALDSSSGDVEWRMEPDGGIVNAPSIGASGLFVTDWEDNLYSIAPVSGKVSWKSSDLVRRSTPMIHEDRLYLVSSQSNQVAVFA